MLQNLKAEAARFGVSTLMLAQETELSDKTIREKIAGKTAFGIDDAMKIRDRFFPGMSLEYLFTPVKNE